MVYLVILIFSCEKAHIAAETKLEIVKLEIMQKTAKFAAPPGDNKHVPFADLDFR